MHAQRDIIIANPSVAYVCPSNSDVVSKRMHISSNFFHRQVEAWL